MRSDLGVAVAIVAAHWTGFCGPAQCVPVPFRTIVRPHAIARAIATGDEVLEEFITASARAPQGARVVPLVHVLHGVHAEEPGILRRVMAMERIICSVRVQE